MPTEPEEQSEKNDIREVRQPDTIAPIFRHEVSHAEHDFNEKKRQEDLTERIRRQRSEQASPITTQLGGRPEIVSDAEVLVRGCNTTDHPVSGEIQVDREHKEELLAELQRNPIVGASNEQASKSAHAKPVLHETKIQEFLQAVKDRPGESTEPMLADITNRTDRNPLDKPVVTVSYDSPPGIGWALLDATDQAEPYPSLDGRINDNDAEPKESNESFLVAKASKEPAKASYYQDLCQGLVDEIKAESGISADAELSSNEIRKVAIDPATRGERAVAAALVSAFNRDDYDRFKPKRHGLIGEFAERHAEDMRASADDFKLKPDSVSDISGKNIRQRFPDSCNLISALIAESEQAGGPERISRMVTANGDGSFAVNFPGRKDSIQVGGLTQAEKMYGSTDDRGYLYVAVLEKAYGIHLNQEKPPNERTVLAADGARFAMSDMPWDHSKGGTAIELLTGQKPDIFNCSKAGLFACKKEELAKAIENANEQGLVVTAGLKSPPEPNHKHLHPNHSYAVLFRNGEMFLRDPLQRGEEKMIPTTVDELHSNFSVVRVEKTKK